MQILWFALLALVAAAQDAPRLRSIPDDPSGRYAMAQEFAACAGHWAFMASLAERAGKLDAKNAFEGSRRGWTLAGMLILAEAMDKTRAEETGTTFEAMVEAKVDQLKALYELNLEADIQDDYQNICVPLTPTQKKIIEIMRRDAVQG